MTYEHACRAIHDHQALQILHLRIQQCKVRIKLAEKYGMTQQVVAERNRLAHLQREVSLIRVANG